jgi:hypothetical protein
MSKRIFCILLLMLLGVAAGFYRSQSQRPPNVVADQLANFNGPINSPQLGAADFSVSEILTALGRLKDISDIRQRTSQFGMLLRRWMERDERGAFAYVSALDEGKTKMQGMALVTEVLARSDPQFLAQKTLSMPGGRSRGELIRGLAGIWSQTDVPGALKWAEQLSEGVEKNDALLIIRSQWASQDPEAASAQISQLPKNSSTAGLVTTAAARWGSSNPTKALEWADTLPKTEKTLAISSSVGAWAQRDPMAAGIYAAQLPPGETQNEAVKSVISSWADQDPAQTAEWVLQFPAGDLQNQGIRQVVSAWNTIDPEEVQDWAMNLPGGPVRDTVLKSFSESNASWTPDKAAGVVGLIRDPLTQEQSTEDIMRSWSKTDPNSARTWLAGLNAPEQSKIRLRSLLPSN